MVVYITIQIGDEKHDVGFYTTDNPDTQGPPPEMIARMVIEWAKDYAGEDADLEL